MCIWEKTIYVVAPLICLLIGGCSNPPIQKTLLPFASETLPIVESTLDAALVSSPPATPDLVATLDAGVSKERATATAWAALPIDMGTPTVPAPRSDGLNLSNSASWARFQNPIGISFEYLVSQVVSMSEVTAYPPGHFSGGWVGALYNGEVRPNFDYSIAVQAYRSAESVVTKESFPDRISMDQGMANWPIRINAPGATDAWIYVFGERNFTANPINLDFWSLAPNLHVELYNAECQVGMGFSTSFGWPGPAADALVRPLDEVVAEHFPVLDHMYRSVQFPPECIAEPTPVPVSAPSSPLATPVQP